MVSCMSCTVCSSIVICSDRPGAINSRIKYTRAKIIRIKINQPNNESGKNPTPNIAAPVNPFRLDSIVRIKETI
jgi:hypothetical protein